MIDTENISALPPSDTMTPEQALLSALEFAKADDLKDVLVIGHDAEGFIIIRSSRMDRKTALWSVKEAEDYVLKRER